jgi:hypothetical protein
MSSVQRKKYEALKYISDNPQCFSKSAGLDGYIVEELLLNNMINGNKSNELGNGDEPRIDRLQILPKGSEFLESYSRFSGLRGFIINPWLVSIISGLAVVSVGYYIVEYLKTL